MIRFFDDLLNTILALVVWSVIVMIVLYCFRLPAMQRAKINLKKVAVKTTEDYRKEIAKVPAEVVQIGENYNHLMEQPTIFYALILFICNHKDSRYRENSVIIFEAWAYVGLRIVHSIVQCFYNKIPLRFGVFLLSSLALSHIALSIFYQELVKQ